MTSDLSSRTEKYLRNLKALCNILRRIAIDAGEITLDYYDDAGLQSHQVSDKGGSPVTEADKKAEAFIVDAIRDVIPDIPIIGEELYSEGRAPDIKGEEYFFLVDSLDGTKEFIAGGEEYTVNIALIHKGVPILGVIYLPVLGELFAGHGPGTALRWTDESNKEKRIQVKRAAANGLTVVMSKSHGHTDIDHPFFDDYKVAKSIKKSSSAKICAVAQGKADIYPRFGPTCEWDIAAGDAILRSAGGLITTFEKTPVEYGKQDEKFLNPYFICAPDGFWDEE